MTSGESQNSFLREPSGPWRPRRLHNDRSSGELYNVAAKPSSSRSSKSAKDAVSVQKKSALAGRRTRTDAIDIDPTSLWTAVANTPGIGISITDVDGRLLFVNDTSKALFSDSIDVSYQGKRIADFHPPEFVEERLEMIRRVLSNSKPLQLSHIYHGRRLESTIWPIRDKKPPYNRVIVVTHEKASVDSLPDLSGKCENVSTRYIDLGPLDVLTNRELEVMVLVGHGLSVPRTARALHRSPKTIQRHKAAIGKKLNISGQADIVAIVTALGLDLKDARLERYSSRG